MMPLTLLPTPLGNLRDITLRALDVLNTAQLLLAEDKRVTLRLLNAHGIHAPRLEVYNEYTTPAALESYLEAARETSVVAVSDAGMPGISDPGTVLIRRARALGIAVELLPGPVAFPAAAVLAGFPTIGLSFEGFVPRTAGARRTAFLDVLKRRGTSTWYESPHRLLETLDILAEIAPQIPIFVLREYTKRFEQHLGGIAAEVKAALALPVRGEITFALDAQAYLAPQPHDAQTALLDRIDALQGEGMPAKTIARTLADAGLGSRRDLYRLTVERGKARTEGTIR